MVTIQAKKYRGHKYWYTFESRRVNGKAGTIVLVCLQRSVEAHAGT